MTPEDVFQKCLECLWPEEGGYSNTPGDSGGATNFGVTERIYDAWRSSQPDHDALPESVCDLTKDIAARVYRDDFWNVQNLDEFVQLGGSPSIALSVFDMGVNASPERAVKLLQATLHIEADGIMGHDTISAAIRQQDHLDVIALYNKRCSNYYQALANQNRDDQQFLRGWLNRIQVRMKFLKANFGYTPIVSA